jgi:hypothetical protein
MSVLQYKHPASDSALHMPSGYLTSFRMALAFQPTHILPKHLPILPADFNTRNVALQLHLSFSSNPYTGIPTSQALTHSATNLVSRATSN